MSKESPRIAQQASFSRNPFNLAVCESSSDSLSFCGFETNSNINSQRRRPFFPDLEWTLQRRLIPPSKQLSAQEIFNKILQKKTVKEGIAKIAEQRREKEEETAEMISQFSKNPESGATSKLGSAAAALSNSAQFSLPKPLIAEAFSLFSSMYSHINERTLTSSLYVFRKAWRSMYESIRVNRNGIDMLKALADRKIPAILLPMHRSHIDYLLLSYICASHDIFPPFIIAGENLNIPLVGSFLRGGGAIFIRRSFGEDPLYKLIFNGYLNVILDSGFQLECYLEGTRSRVGKMKAPKIGFMKNLATILEQRINFLHANKSDGEAQQRWKDLALVPISISYDSLIESSSFVNEMLGEQKKAESLKTALLSSANVLRLNFGSIDVHIAQPFSLREALFEFIRSLPAATSSQTPLTGPLLDPKDDPRNYAFSKLSPSLQRRFLLGLSHRIFYEMNNKCVISPTSIVSTVLLTSNSPGIHRKEIQRRVKWLAAAIRERGGQVSQIFHNVESEANAAHLILDKSLKSLRKLVREDHAIIHSYRNRESLELSIYRNQLLHFFVSESMVCIAMAAESRELRNQIKATRIRQMKKGISTAGQGGTLSVNASPDSSGIGDFDLSTASTNISCEHSKLIDSVRFLSSLLKFEFVFEPSYDLELNLEKTLLALIQRRVLILNAQPDSVASRVEEEASRGANLNILSNSRIFLSENERNREIFLFLCNLLWPFVDTYIVGILSLYALQENGIMSINDLARLTSQLAEALFYSGSLDFFECLNVDALLNSYDWCENQGLITTCRFSNSPACPLEFRNAAILHNCKPGTKMVQLNRAFQEEQKQAKPSRISPQVSNSNLTLRDLQFIENQDSDAEQEFAAANVAAANSDLSISAAVENPLLKAEAGNDFPLPVPFQSLALSSNQILALHSNDLTNIEVRKIPSAVQINEQIYGKLQNSQGLAQASMKKGDEAPPKSHASASPHYHSHSHSPSPSPSPAAPSFPLSFRRVYYR